MRMMKTLWLLGVAALALGLSGCGGGGSTRPDTSSQASTTPPAEPPMATPVQGGDLGAGMVTVGITRADQATDASFTFMNPSLTFFAVIHGDEA